MKPLAERVKDGAAFLDERLPNWVWKIDISRLQMDQSCHCILGQDFGHYCIGKEKLNISEEDAENLAFMLYDDEFCHLKNTLGLGHNAYTDALNYWNNLWIAEVKQRLDAQYPTIPQSDV